MSAVTSVTASFNESNSNIQKIGYFLGPFLFLCTMFIAPPSGMEAAAWNVCGLALWMAVWWMTEAIPLPATALLPVIVYPLCDISPIRAVLTPYASPIIFLFLGGFLIAMAIQKSNLHLRIALNIVRVIGTQPDRMVGGFMVASAFLSMWISNTATMLMMLPIALSVVALMKEEMEDSKSCCPKQFSICMLLGIAYASSVGGIGTLIGTPPNAIMSGYMEQTYNFNIGFFEWMKVGIPMVIIMLAVMWWLMTHVLFKISCGGKNQSSCNIIDQEMAKLGRMSADEKRVTIVAASTAMLWMFHPLLSKVIPVTFNDTVIAMMGAMALFAIPMDFRSHRCILTWKDAEKLPWGILILFGGGLAMASGFGASGLSDWIGSSFAGFAGISPVLLLAMVLATLMICTNLMSNVASINIFLPIIVPMAVGMNMNPLFFTIPATMAASCAFMLPVSTANNAIAFGTGHVSIAQMARTGLLLNLIALPILIILTYVLIIPAFDIDLGVVPDWALAANK